MHDLLSSTSIQYCFHSHINPDIFKKMRWSDITLHLSNNFFKYVRIKIWIYGLLHKGNKNFWLLVGTGRTLQVNHIRNTFYKFFGWKSLCDATCFTAKRMNITSVSHMVKPWSQKKYAYRLQQSNLQKKSYLSRP